jgi:2-dehydropantoate 2-reductase
MKVMILGAGAMGSLFGGMLKQAGNDVLLVDVWKEHVEAIKANGLIMEKGEVRQVVSIPAALPAEVRMAPDLIVIFTKSFHTQTAFESVKHAITDSTHVLTLQNGVGHVDIIARFVGLERIIHGVTTYPCDLAGPGHIRTPGEGAIKFMTVNGNPGKMLDAVNTMFREAKMNSTIVPDIERAIWEKLAFNAAMNALCAVLRVTVGQLGSTSHGRDMAAAIVDEVVGVAQAKGIRADKTTISDTLAMAFREHKAHMPSMLQDVLHKKKTEIDFINGAAVTTGRAIGLDLPVNETVYRLIKVLESSYLPEEGGSHAT